MTYSDVYVVITFGAVALSAAALAGWSIDRWPEWEQRHEAFTSAAGFRWWLVKQDAMWRLGGTVFRPWLDPSPVPRGRAR